MEAPHFRETTAIPKCFHLAQTLDCGQAFRWRPADPQGLVWEGAAKDRYLRLEDRGETLALSCSQEELEEFWSGYFDLETDYEEKRRALSGMSPALAQAAAFAPGDSHPPPGPLGGLVLLSHLPKQPHPPDQGDHRAAVPAAGGAHRGHGLAQLSRAGEALRLLPGGPGPLCGRGFGPSTCWTPPGRWRPGRWTWTGWPAPRWKRAVRSCKRSTGWGPRWRSAPCSTAFTRRSASPWTCG